jgi:hypothetical protein
MCPFLTHAANQSWKNVSSRLVSINATAIILDTLAMAGAKIAACVCTDVGCAVVATKDS